MRRSWPQPSPDSPCRPPAQDGLAAGVQLFDRICYSTMPSLSAVEAQATSWRPITGAELDTFRPSVATDVLKAWKFEAEGGTYSVAVTRSPMDEQSKADFPKYKDATNFACSLVLPTDKPAPGVIAAGMAKLVERKPDAAYEEGPWSVSSWSGGNDKLFVLVYHYAPKSGAPGGLLSMTVFQRP